jgi:hypothetical protein
MKNKSKHIALLLLFMFIIAVVFFGVYFVKQKNMLQSSHSTEEIPNTETVSLPVGYSVKDYTVTEVTRQICENHDDCSLPMEYAIRSNCPYTSLCINKSCTVVCPIFNEEEVVAFRKQSPFNPEIEQAIKEYLLSQNEFSWVTVSNSQRQCNVENLGKEKTFPLSLWVVCEEYVVKEDGTVEILSGSSGPVLLEYMGDLSYIDIAAFSHQAPRDGSLYTKDVQTIFPIEVQEIIFNY